MNNNLFDEFQPVSSKQWKQQIQYELKGADYNETLIWETAEGIKVKPFYHGDEFKKLDVDFSSNSEFKILQKIFVHDVEKSNLNAIDIINRGAESIYFTLENNSISIEKLCQSLPKNIHYFFNFPFLDKDYIVNANDYLTKNNFKFSLILDPIGQLCRDGNWFSNFENDFKLLDEIQKSSTSSSIAVNASIYQNAGADIVQQLTYSLAHVCEYFQNIKSINHPITVEIAVGSNYFFEIAKLRAFRVLFQSLAKEFNHPHDCVLLAYPSKRNKTLYDYNVNMLRTTTECMSAILGNADYVTNLAYDTLYHKENEFGNRIARNQLLILKHESYFDKVINPADGSYYIEEITNQLVEKALESFKLLEKNGGLINQLHKGTIQQKINAAAEKEQELFDKGQEILIGTNKFPNKNDQMKQELELYPFVKQKPRKTVIIPIIEKRLAEKMEQERLASE